jgi:hypothetical protein
MICPGWPFSEFSSALAPACTPRLFCRLLQRPARGFVRVTKNTCDDPLSVVMTAVKLVRRGRARAALCRLSRRRCRSGQCAGPWLHVRAPGRPSRQGASCLQRHAAAAVGPSGVPARALIANRSACSTFSPTAAFQPVTMKTEATVTAVISALERLPGTKRPRSASSTDETLGSPRRANPGRRRSKGR